MNRANAKMLKTETLTRAVPVSASQRFIVSAFYQLAALLLVLGAGVGSPAAAAEAEASENQVKAAFLLNFPKYVEWPAEAFAASNSPLVVVILGSPGMAAEFAKMSADKTVNGRSLVLSTEPPTADDPKGCHILFISTTTRRPTEILAGLKGRSVLTVGDDEKFLEQGGMIRLARREQNVRLQVQLAAAQQAQLKISSKLLSIADVVKGRSK
jgi:hypothetical protein